MKRELQRIAAATAIALLPTACATLSPPSGRESASTDAAREALGSSATPTESDRALSRSAARDIANNCFTCHGPNGRSPAPVPSLDRLSADQIAAAMAEFKIGKRSSTAMGRYARAYSDAEINAVASYIAALRR